LSDSRSREWKGRKRWTEERANEGQERKRKRCKTARKESFEDRPQKRNRFPTVPKFEKETRRGQRSKSFPSLQIPLVLSRRNPREGSHPNPDSWPQSRHSSQRIANGKRTFLLRWSLAFASFVGGRICCRRSNGHARGTVPRAPFAFKGSMIRGALQFT